MGAGKIAFIGDVHGNIGLMSRLVDRIAGGVDRIIQVGDLGLWPGASGEEDSPSREVWWVDGNHEYFPDLYGIKHPSQIRRNLVYMPRGVVLSACGLRIGFMGGGESLDKDRRTPGSDWFPEESMTWWDFERILDNTAGEDLNVLVSHTPPLEVVRRMLRPHDRVGATAHGVQEIVERCRPDLVVCGHMHHRYSHRMDCGTQVEVLPTLGVGIMDAGSMDFVFLEDEWKEAASGHRWRIEQVV